MNLQSLTKSVKLYLLYLLWLAFLLTNIRVTLLVISQLTGSTQSSKCRKADAIYRQHTLHLASVKCV